MSDSVFMLLMGDTVDDNVGLDQRKIILPETIDGAGYFDTPGIKPKHRYIIKNREASVGGKPDSRNARKDVPSRSKSLDMRKGGAEKIREPTAKVTPEDQVHREEQPPRQPRQTEIRDMEEVEMDEVPDIQMEVEHPVPRVTAPANPPAKPRGTAMMDAPGWSNIDPGNIVTGGRSTRRSAGSAMHAEEADQIA